MKRTKKAMKPKTRTKEKVGPYGKLTHSELVETYNVMAAHPLVLQQANPRYRPVHKFQTNEIGAKRCELLASTIRALQANVRDGKPIRRIGPEKIVDVKKLVEEEDAPPGSEEAIRRKEHRARIFQQFRLRMGTKQEVITAGLVRNLNKWVARKTLLQAMYGTDNKKHINVLNMLLYAMERSIKKRKIPIVLCTDVKYEEKVYGLFETDRT